MDITSLARALRKLWLLVVVLAAVGAGGGALVYALVPPSYQATSRTYFAFQPRANATAGDLVAVNQYAVQKVVSYVQIVRTPRVLQPVIQQLALNTTAADLADDVSVSAPPDSVIIEISASASTARDAARLTNAVSSAFVNVVVNEIERSTDGRGVTVQAEQLETAVPPTSASGASLVLHVLLGTLAGIVVALMTAVLTAIGDRRVHNRDELERLLRTRVVGSLPAIGAGTFRDMQSRETTVETAAFRALSAGIAIDRRLVAGRSLAVLSPTTGESATAVVTNTAVGLAQSGLRVIVIDGDFTRRAVSAAFDLDGDPGLAETLRSDANAVPQPTKVPGLLVLPAGSLTDRVPDAVATAKLRLLLQQFADEADLVLIAAPPLLDGGGAAGFLAAAAPGSLLVVDAGKTHVPEVREALETLDRAGSEVRIVLANVPTSGPDSDVRSRALGAPQGAAPAKARLPLLRLRHA